MLHTKFQVNWLLGLGEEAKKRFSRWPPWQPSWISDQHYFSYFWSTSHPDASYQVWIGLSAQVMKWKIDFQDGGHDGHLGFPIGTILAIFDLQVTPMLPTNFRVNWHLGLGEEAKNMYVLRFYGPVNPVESCWARSVYLTTHLLGRLSPLSS